MERRRKNSLREVWLLILVVLLIKTCQLLEVSVKSVLEAKVLLLRRRGARRRLCKRLEN